jgi:hypothetical protein
VGNFGVLEAARRGNAALHFAAANLFFPCRP